MNLGGLVIVLAGIWVSTQVIGGGALVRLRVLNSDTDSSTTSTTTSDASKGDRSGGSGTFTKGTS